MSTQTVRFQDFRNTLNSGESKSYKIPVRTEIFIDVHEGELSGQFFDQQDNDAGGFQLDEDLARLSNKFWIDEHNPNETHEVEIVAESATLEYSVTAFKL